MALTKEHVQALTKPFNADDHEFIRGFVYISELAITTRLDEVDPSWSFEVLSNIQRDKQVVATARMAVCEVARDGVGMQSMEFLTDYDKATRTKTYRLDPDGNKIDAGEAEKGSVTDALRRCARLFGVGRYLLDNPPKVVTDDYGNVKDKTQFDAWLAKQQRAHADQWGYELPSRNGNNPPPTPPSSPTPPTNEKPDLAVVERTDIAPAREEVQPLAKAAGAEHDDVREKLGNGGKRRIDGEPKAKVANGLGVVFGRWYADKKDARGLPSQDQVLESMGIKFPNEYAGTAEEFERALDAKWPEGGAK